MSEQNSGYGGGGRWKKYLLWYLIGAVVVYGLVWLIFLKDGGYGG
jgi:hypothetical protein